LGYHTHWQDENLTLLQLGVRFYDPEIGRFEQRDPAWDDDVSPFIYAVDCPTLATDPTGLKSLAGTGKLEVDKSCAELVRMGVIQYCPEEPPYGGKKPNVCETMEVDALFLYCNGEWFPLKIPDGGKCTLKCSKTTKKDTTTWEITYTCTRNLRCKIARHYFEPGVDPNKTCPKKAPKLPSKTTISCSGKLDRKNHHP